MLADSAETSSPNRTRFAGLRFGAALPRSFFYRQNGSHPRWRECSQILPKRPLQIEPASLGFDLALRSRAAFFIGRIVRICASAFARRFCRNVLSKSNPLRWASIWRCAPAQPSLFGRMWFFCPSNSAERRLTAPARMHLRLPRSSHPFRFPEVLTGKTTRFSRFHPGKGDFPFPGPFFCNRRGRLFTEPPLSICCGIWLSNPFQGTGSLTGSSDTGRSRPDISGTARWG